MQRKPGITISFTVKEPGREKRRDRRRRKKIGINVALNKLKQKRKRKRSMRPGQKPILRKPPRKPRRNANVNAPKTIAIRCVRIVNVPHPLAKSDKAQTTTMMAILRPTRSAWIGKWAIIQTRRGLRRNDLPRLYRKALRGGSPGAHQDGQRHHRRISSEGIFTHPSPALLSARRSRID